MHITDSIADMLTRIRNAECRKARNSRCTRFQDEEGDRPDSPG